MRKFYLLVVAMLAGFVAMAGNTWELTDDNEIVVAYNAGGSNWQAGSTDVVSEAMNAATGTLPDGWTPALGESITFTISGIPSHSGKFQFALIDERQEADWYTEMSKTYVSMNVVKGEKFELSGKLTIDNVDKSREGNEVALTAPGIVLAFTPYDDDLDAPDPFTLTDAAFEAIFAEALYLPDGAIAVDPAPEALDVEGHYKYEREESLSTVVDVETGKWFNVTIEGKPTTDVFNMQIAFADIVQTKDGNWWHELTQITPFAQDIAKYDAFKCQFSIPVEAVVAESDFMDEYAFHNFRCSLLFLTNVAAEEGSLVIEDYRLTVTAGDKAYDDPRYGVVLYNVSLFFPNYWYDYGTLNGDGYYEEGETIEISATPNFGYKFVKWNDDNTDNPRTITVTSDMEFTAYFEQTAYDFMVDGIGYVITEEGEVAVTYTSGYYYYDAQSDYSGDIVIPSSVTFNDVEYAVTSISDRAFKGSEGMTSITIPNSVTSIGSNAFEGCTGLTSISIPKGLDLSNAGLEFIVNGVKYNVINEKEVKVANNSYTGDVVIPSTVSAFGTTYSVTTIGREAFYGCEGLTSVTIPDGVTTIAPEAFSSSSISSLTIPESVTEIGYSAFSWCKKLTAITILNKDVTFDGSPFYGCDSLKEYYGPAEPFNYYDSDYGYEMPEMTCSAFEKITFTTGSLERVGFEVVSKSSRTLKELDLSATSNTEIPEITFANFYKLDKVVLPSKLESVGFKAFDGCMALKEVSIPATVTTIGNSAFEDCRKMEKLTFEGADSEEATCSIESIGDWAFYNCHNLKSVVIPEGVTSLGDAAFYGCAYMENLELPSTLKSMGDNCFALCENLKSLSVSADVPPTLFEKSFYNVDRTIPVSVPEASLKAYEEAEYWNEFIHLKASEAPTAIVAVEESAAVSIANGTVFVNGEAPAFVVTITGQKIANANLKAGVYFVVVDGFTTKVLVK